MLSEVLAGQGVEAKLRVVGIVLQLVENKRKRVREVAVTKTSLPRDRGKPNGLGRDCIGTSRVD